MSATQRRTYRPSIIKHGTTCRPRHRYNACAFRCGTSSFASPTHVWSGSADHSKSTMSNVTGGSHMTLAPLVKYQNHDPRLGLALTLQCATSPSVFPDCLCSNTCWLSALPRIMRYLARTLPHPSSGPNHAVSVHHCTEFHPTRCLMFTGWGFVLKILDRVASRLPLNRLACRA